MNITEIDNINAPEIGVFTMATEPQLRRQGVFLAESANVILRALEAGYDPVQMLVETERIAAEAKPVFDAVEQILGRDRLESLPVYSVPRETVTGITGHHLVRGLWMMMRRRPEITVSDFCRDKKRIAVLVDVVNPVNVGAIFRSAAALGMDGVLMSHKSVDPLTRRVARVSMGTVFQIPWARASEPDPDGMSLSRVLHSFGFKTVAMALTEDSVSIDNDEIRKNDKIAILLGTEGTGLPTGVIADSDYRVMIPMHYGVDSLNVAAASAISFWEILK